MKRIPALILASALFAFPIPASALSSSDIFGSSGSLSSDTGTTPTGSGNQAYATDTTRPVLWQESFDDVDTTSGFNKQGPSGFSVATNEIKSGEERWKGWTWTNTRDWTWAVGTEERHYFTRGDGSYAVAESKHHRIAAPEEMSTTLRTPEIPLQPGAAFEFDSHYKQGSAENFAQVTAHYNTGATQELLKLDATKFSSHEVLPLDAPAGATSVHFTFDYANAQDDWFWAVDNLALTQPLGASADKPSAIIDVLSDTHGHTEKYARAMNTLNSQPDPAGAIVFNGDYVDVGAQEDYDAFMADRKAYPHASGREYFTIGNHEMLGQEGSDVYLKRFLDMTGQEHVWREEIVNGQPIITISTEHYEDRLREGKEPYVVLSEEQLRFIDERLGYWEAQGTPVLLFSHLVLPNTVSLTHSAWYGNDFASLNDFSAVVGKYQNVVMFTSHTHASFDLEDWWGVYRDDATGNHAGFPVVNTGALLNNTMPDGDHDEYKLDGDNSTGLRVKVFGDRVRVEAWDFVTGTMIKYQDFARKA
ncbi:metallophosphoesterase [Corynebacterium sp. H128]|uniref:metallophosphoesterase n=1 Tax=Corynebacterium sp. H128 TaxID=3133427 RepID=UPI0030989BD8